MSVNVFKLLAMLLLASTLAACAGTSTDEAGGASSESDSTAGASGSDTIESTAIDGDGIATGEAADASASLLDQKIIYFDYDESLITDQGREIIQAHAEYLSTRRSLSVLLEGHADERGTREYNLALGDLRADAVNLELQKLGIDGSRITTISHGEEVPVADGHDEESWSLNRRVEIIY